MDVVEKRGLWDNIHAKRERIKRGSGEHMRRPGEAGRPTSSDFKTASESIDVKPHDKSRHVKTPETAELQSMDKNDPDSRFDSTDSLVRVYKSITPGQGGKLETVKKVVREALYQGKHVELNKPMKGDVKKSKVYVKNASGHVVKVNFGDKTLSIKKNIPARKRSYCARSSGQGNLTDKTKANYWSRRAWNC